MRLGDGRRLCREPLLLLAAVLAGVLLVGCGDSAGSTAEVTSRATDPSATPTTDAAAQAYATMTPSPKANPPGSGEGIAGSWLSQHSNTNDDPLAEGPWSDGAQRTTYMPNGRFKVDFLDPEVISEPIAGLYSVDEGAWIPGQKPPSKPYGCISYTATSASGEKWQEYFRLIDGGATLVLWLAGSSDANFRMKRL
jgi:hypothetical protein